MTPTWDPGPLPTPDAGAVSEARRRLDALAKPPGSLGRLEDLAAWWAGVVGPDTGPPASPALVIAAADHGIAARGVSAYPSSVTAAMVRTFLSGGAAASVLASEHGVALRVVDVGVDTDWADDPLPAAVTAGKAVRGSTPLDVGDALTGSQLETAVATGRRQADALVDSGHDLLLTGDMGIGNTTAAAATVALLTGTEAESAVGRGTGVDDAGLARKRDAVAAALRRARDRPGHAVGGWEAVRRVGGGDIAALAGLCLQAAVRRTPVLLDGVVSGAAALVAHAVAPGCVAWFAAGHRSTEPAHRIALDALALRPVLDLDMRLGEGTGALLALPILRSAVAVARGMATLTDVVGPAGEAAASDLA